MTIELQNTLIRELDDAKKIEDRDRRDEAIQTVQSHMLSALIDCQRKTAERVKDLVATAESARLKIEGARMLWTALRYIAACGAGGAIVKIASVAV